MKSTQSTPIRPAPLSVESSTFDVRRSKSYVRRSLSIASRAVAALLGGYALAASASVALTLLSSAPREDATASATATAFLLYAGAILWAFTARTAARAVLGVALPSALFTGLAWWLLPTVTP